MSLKFIWEFPPINLHIKLDQHKKKKAFILFIVSAISNDFRDCFCTIKIMLDKIFHRFSSIFTIFSSFSSTKRKHFNFFSSAFVSCHARNLFLCIVFIHYSNRIKAHKEGTWGIFPRENRLRHKSKRKEMKQQCAKQCTHWKGKGFVVWTFFRGQTFGRLPWLQRDFKVPLFCVLAKALSIDNRQRRHERWQ